jgi:hypothetical protein
VGLRSSFPGPQNELRLIRHRRLSFASKKKARFVSDLGNKFPIGDSRRGRTEWHVASAVPVWTMLKRWDDKGDRMPSAGQIDHLLVSMV